MTLTACLNVFIGAGLGGVLRHLINILSVRTLGMAFPFGTFFINVTGSLLMGLVVGYFAFFGSAPQPVRLFIATGVINSRFGTLVAAMHTIAVALLGRLHPAGVAAAALFFGALAAGSGAMQRTAGVSAVFVAIVQATVILGLLAGAAFEPHDTRLWNRITRELTTWFEGLFRAGALKGRTAAEAFFVQCDGTTNPPEVRDTGRVVTVIGLAPAVPNEFVVVRIVHGRH